MNLKEGSEAYQIQAKIYEYRDGQVVETAVWDFLNYEIGKEETQLIEQLRSMGFDKTADAIYDRDVFHLCAADEGVEPLFKISLINSSATGETDWDEMPTAVIRQINAGLMEEEFLLPESNSRVLEADELSGMTKAQLGIARNEIYARYGWWFENEELADYFEGKAWYAVSENVDDIILSQVERTNIALKESDIDALLKRRTGYGLSDMRNPLLWIYLKEEKVYCMEAGDTNYMEVSVVDGMKTDDGMYYILYENPFLEYTSEETMCIVTLKKQGEEYQFVSNVRQ